MSESQTHLTLRDNTRLLPISRHLEHHLYKYNHLFFHFTFLTTLIQHPSGEHSRKTFFQPRSCYGRTEQFQASVFAPATGEHTCEALTCPAQSGAATCPLLPLKHPNPFVSSSSSPQQPASEEFSDFHTPQASICRRKGDPDREKGGKRSLLC